MLHLLELTRARRTVDLKKIARAVARNDKKRRYECVNATIVQL